MKANFPSESDVNGWDSGKKGWLILVKRCEKSEEEEKEDKEDKIEGREKIKERVFSNRIGWKGMEKREKGGCYGSGKKGERAI